MSLTFYRVAGHTGGNEMLDQVQVIKENDQAKFAVIPFEEYIFLKELLSNEEKLADYLDYLHVRKVKGHSQARFSLAEVKQALALD
jgi:hypothetical protein